MNKRKKKLRLYHARDGWRYTLKRSGRIIDASTQGYARRDAAVANMISKGKAYLRAERDDVWKMLRTQRGRVIELEL